MRTYWMRLFLIANVALVAVLVYFFFSFVLPNASKPDTAPFVPVFVVFIVAFVAIVIAGGAWAGAPRRRWFWLLGSIPALLLLLMFGPEITYDIARPTVATSFIPTLVAVSGALLTLVAGVISFRQVGRTAKSGAATDAGAATATSARTRLALAGILGLITGAVLTSLAAGASASAGGSVAEAPTTSTTIQAKDTKFIETSFTMKNGEVLGIFVINRDSFGHSFDIDALNVHVTLPPSSTTAVAIKPTAAGTLEFYCSIPGHRQNGMLGTITVQ